MVLQWNVMIRIKSTLTARMSGGNLTGLLMYIFVLLVTPFLVLGTIASESPRSYWLIISVYAACLGVCLYRYFRCGVFYTETEIIERRLYKTVSIKIRNISSVILDCYAGPRYQETIITLVDNDAYVLAGGALANTSIWRVLFSDTPGDFKLKSVRMMYRKKSARRFARALLKVIRNAGNSSANVVIAKSVSDTKWKASKDHVMERFWLGFTENE